VASNKQAEIEAAAIRLFGEKGYHATSMQDIADAVGLQKGSLYHYISSKEDLLVAIIHDAIAQYNARLSEVKAMNLPVRRKLELAVRSHLQGIADNLSMLTIFFRESYALNPDQRKLLDTESEHYNQMFEQLLEEGIVTGEVRQIDAKLATRSILGGCNWFYQWYRPDGTKSMGELADFYVDLMLGGISPQPKGQLL
jgi:AcrR family transcriptional regulator